MSESIFIEVEKDLQSRGFIMEGPFRPMYIGEGHFIVQSRKRGESFDEMCSSIVRSFDEIVRVGFC